MVYMTVVSRNSTVLHLARSPGLRAWSTFVGILAVGSGMVVFSSDDWLWKMFCLFCCGFVATCSLDDWEECVIEKQGEIHLKRFSVIEKLLRPKEHQRHVVAEADNIMKAVVESEDIRFFGTGRLVMLYFSTGYSLPLTEKCTLGDGSDHQLIADIISGFLELSKKKQMHTCTGFQDGTAQPPPFPPSSSSSSSDDDEEEEERGDFKSR